MRPLQIYFLLLCLVSTFNLWAQEPEQYNQTDEQGRKTGFWIHRSEETQAKLEEGAYVNGQKHGTWKAYYPDGTLKHQITFENGIAKGKASFYYPDGTLWEEGVWNEYCWTGEYRLYYPNGQAAYEWTYNQQGHREGEQKYYFENGAVKYKGDWTNGQITGNVEVYDSTGLLVQTRVYNKEGVFETAKKPDSILPQNTESQPGKSFSPFHGTGYHTLYRLNGKVEQKGYFREGNLVNGEAYVYDDEGTLRQIRVYENGKLIKIKPVTQEQAETEPTSN